ncbi:zinc finger protein 761-like [Ylistrum balloti]|uniref:zinc finger protein 761-like n=1 Tax=Ylistrum balloti TaxID=509963 RepID=UPI002905F41E|nr:zinc finger protein 761-like [Ylistrum balloti]
MAAGKKERKKDGVRESRRGRPRTRNVERSRALIQTFPRKKKNFPRQVLLENDVDCERLNAIKTTRKLKSNSDVVRFLLDRYENISRSGISSTGRRRKNLPEEFDDYQFHCKSCGSEDIEVMAKVRAPPQTSLPADRVSVKIECDDNIMSNDKHIKETRSAAKNALLEPRPTNLFCNASVIRDINKANCEDDETVPYKKRRKRTFPITADETAPITTPKSNTNINEISSTVTKSTTETDEVAATKSTTETDEVAATKSATKTDEVIATTKNSTIENTATKSAEPVTCADTEESMEQTAVENSDDQVDKVTYNQENLVENKESDEDDGRRRSTRLKGKDRISFTKMIELDISDEDLDNSEDDLDEEEDDDDEMCDEDEIEEGESREISKIKQKKNEVKDVDPDFDPGTDDEDVKVEVSDGHSAEESVGGVTTPKLKRGRKKKWLEDESDPENFWRVRKKYKLTVKEKEAKRIAKVRKKERKQQLKELRTIHRSAIEKCQDMTVKLEDHEDKYELTVFTSQSQKDRNLDFEHKSYYRYTCKLCDGQFNASDKASMENHIKLHLQGQLTCGDCGLTFSKPLVLFHHKIEKHIEKFYTCEFCAEQFYTQRSLKVHLAKKHDQKPFKCPKCLEYFSCRADKKKHVTVAHPELAAQCEKCGEFFFGPDRLQCHVKGMKCKEKSSSEGNKIPCEVCGKIVLRSGMKKHMDTIHLKIHSHKCEICSFTTNSTQSIKNHRMRHTGVHPFKCQLCDFSCVQDYQLKSHMRTHTGEKPYKCDQCSYASAWNVQLKEHRKAHQSPTQSTCDICNITFKHDRGISLHMKKHHSNLVTGASKKVERSGPCSEAATNKAVSANKDVNQKLGSKIIVIGSSQLEGITGPNHIPEEVQDQQIDLQRTPATQYVAMKQTEYHSDLSGTSNQAEYQSREKTQYHSPKQVEYQQQTEYISPKLTEYNLSKQTEYTSKEIEYGISHTEYVTTSDQTYSEVHVNYSPDNAEYDATQPGYIVHISCQPDYMPAEQVITTSSDV